MIVYLLRHAVAEEHDPQKYPDDDQRPLTADGTEKMRAAADGIARIIDPPDLLLTSPLIRAAQTAKIVARALGRKEHVEFDDSLRPGANAKALRPHLSARAESGVKSIMLVGHEPDLGQIASALIGAAGSVVEFKKGSLCAIRIDDEHPDQPAALLWHLSPRQLREIAR